MGTELGVGGRSQFLFATGVSPRKVLRPRSSHVPLLMPLVPRGSTWLRYGAAFDAAYGSQCLVQPSVAWRILFIYFPKAGGRLAFSAAVDARVLGISALVFPPLSAPIHTPKEHGAGNLYTCIDVNRALPQSLSHLPFATHMTSSLGYLNCTAANTGFSRHAPPVANNPLQTTPARTQTCVSIHRSQSDEKDVPPRALLVNIVAARHCRNYFFLAHLGHFQSSSGTFSSGGERQ